MQPSPPDQSKKFMQTGVGILALVLAAIVVLPIVCCSGLWVTGLFVSAVNP